MLAAAAMAEAGRDALASVSRFRFVGGARRAFDASSLAAGGVALGGDGSVYGSVFGLESYAKRQYDDLEGWVYASLRPIAQTIAGCEVVVAREMPAARGSSRGRSRWDASAVPRFLKQVELEPYPSHPLLDLLNRPNPLMVRWHVLYLLALSLELTGRSHWWIARAQDGVKLWPIPSSWIRPEFAKANEGSSVGAVARWLIRPGGAGEEVPVPIEEVVYFYYPSPASMVETFSPTTAARRAINADHAIEDTQVRAFANGAFPGLAVIIGDVEDPESGESARPALEREQRQQIITAFMRHYGSMVNYGAPIILDAVVRDVKQITNAPREMDFLNSGRSTKARITQAYGVNPIIMGEIEGANRASSAVARKHFADFTVNPKIDLISQVLDAALGPLYSRGDRGKTRVYIEPYRPDDSEERRADWREAIGARAVTYNEVRSGLLGLAPLDEGGDELLAPASAPSPFALPAGGAAARPRIKAAAGGALDGKQWRAACRHVWLRAHGDRELDLGAAIANLFVRQRADIAAKLIAMTGGKQAGAALAAGFDAAGLAAELFRPADWRGALIDAVRSPLAGSMALGAWIALQSVGRRRAKQLDDAAWEDILGFYRIDLDSDVRARIEAELETILARDYWDEINRTTLQDLRATLAEGVREGESLAELSWRIEGSGRWPGVLGNETAAMRAQRIARTETTMALNAGQYQQMAELRADGVVRGQEWSATIDDVTRDTHAALDGKRAPGDFPGDEFRVGDSWAPYPGHPTLPAEERCNCRCVLLAVVED